jgi:Holliday junction resolvasome RuvABC endonuclease subunit
MTQENPVLLALYPSSVGMGYACLQIPDQLLDFGIATIKPMLNGKLLSRAERFMEYYKPKVILLKEKHSSKNSKRNDNLIDALASLSYEKNIQVYRYTREQIKDVFEIFGARSKYEMAQRIIKMLPDLEHRSPKMKKWYEKEDYNMVLFDAVSLAVTHTYLTE